MEGLITDRLAYCENSNTMRAYFEANIPPVPGSNDHRPGKDYTIIATFEQVTPKNSTAAQDIEDPNLNHTTRQ